MIKIQNFLKRFGEICATFAPKVFYTCTCSQQRQFCWKKKQLYCLMIICKGHLELYCKALFSHVCLGTIIFCCLKPMNKCLAAKSIRRNHANGVTSHISCCERNVVQNLDMVEHMAQSKRVRRENGASLGNVRTMLQWAQPRGLKCAKLKRLVFCMFSEFWDRSRSRWRQPRPESQLGWIPCCSKGVI